MDTIKIYQKIERNLVRRERRSTNGRAELASVARNISRAVIILVAALMLFLGCAAQAPLSSDEYHAQQQEHIQNQLQTARRRSEATRRRIKQERLNRQRLVSIATDARWVELRRVIEGAQSGRKERL